MISLSIILLFIFFIFTYLLFAPLYLEINSETGLCRIRFHRIASASLIMKNSIWIHIKIAWWNKRIDLLSNGTQNKNVKPGNRKHGAGIPFKNIWQVIKSFKISKCNVTIDSGNMPLNGILYPVFNLLSRRTGNHIGINFRGENEIMFTVKNNFARMIWVFHFRS